MNPPNPTNPADSASPVNSGGLANSTDPVGSIEPANPQIGQSLDSQHPSTQPTQPPAPSYNLNFNPNVYPDKNPSRDDLVFGPAPTFPDRPQPQPSPEPDPVSAPAPAAEKSTKFFTPKTIAGLIAAGILLIAGLIITVVFTTRPTPDSSSNTADSNEDSLASNPRPASVVYVDNDTIDNFAKKYNSLHPNNRITTGMLKPVTDDGIEDPDRVEFFFQDSEVILSGDDATNTASVFFSNPDKQGNAAIQQLFNEFMRVFDDKLSDDELAADWETITSKPASINTLHNVECRATMKNRHVDYILLKGVIK